MNQLAFDAEKMSLLSSNGFERYQEAELSYSPEKFFQAGINYDRSFLKSWGEYIFAGTAWQDFIRNVSLNPDQISEELAKKLIRNSQESLVISCECYIRSLQYDKDNYSYNLRLAIALTAALQVEASIPYWKKCIQLSSLETANILIANLMRPNNIGLAIRIATLYLGIGQISFSDVVNKDETKIFREIDSITKSSLKALQTAPAGDYIFTCVASYSEQRKLANSLLKLSPLIRENVNYLNLFKDKNTNEAPSPVYRKIVEMLKSII